MRIYTLPLPIPDPISNIYAHKPKPIDWLMESGYYCNLVIKINLNSKH